MWLWVFVAARGGFSSCRRVEATLCLWRVGVSLWWLLLWEQALGCARLESTDSVVVVCGLCCPVVYEVFQDRDWTHISCVGSWILKPRTFCFMLSTTLRVDHSPLVIFSKILTSGGNHLLMSFVFPISTLLPCPRQSIRRSRNEWPIECIPSPTIQLTEND